MVSVYTHKMVVEYLNYQFLNSVKSKRNREIAREFLEGLCLKGFNPIFQNDAIIYLTVHLCYVIIK